MIPKTTDELKKNHTNIFRFEFSNFSVNDDKLTIAYSMVFQ